VILCETTEIVSFMCAQCVFLLASYLSVYFAHIKFKFTEVYIINSSFSDHV